jgi:type II secretory pathway component PulL
MKVPTSFIARLAENGDSWLESEEAQAAVLKKLPEQKSTSLETTPQTTEPEVEPSIPSIIIHNTFSPSSSQSNLSQPLDDSSGRSAAFASWISAWGTWAAVIVAVVAIVVTLKLAGNI